MRDESRPREEAVCMAGATPSKNCACRLGTVLSYLMLTCNTVDQEVIIVTVPYQTLIQQQPNSIQCWSQDETSICRILRV